MTTTYLPAARPASNMSMQRQAKFTWIPSSVPYYLNLGKDGVLERLQYRVRGKAIIYAIRCQVTNMVYVGSTLNPGRRLYLHLVKGQQSNIRLQSAIRQYGINKVTAYILEVVEFPKGLTYMQRKAYLRGVEQTHMDRFPKAQLYNTIRSVKA